MDLLAGVNGCNDEISQWILVWLPRALGSKCGLVAELIEETETSLLVVIVAKQTTLVVIVLVEQISKYSNLVFIIAVDTNLRIYLKFVKSILFNHINMASTKFSANH